MIGQVFKIYFALLLLMSRMAHADSTLICGDSSYAVEKGLLGGTITRIKSGTQTPFCVSDDPAVLTKTLSFRDAEVWCVTSHHLSLNSRAVAKQLWVLNTLTKKLYLYDYMFADNAWILQSERIETCDLDRQN